MHHAFRVAAASGVLIASGLLATAKSAAPDPLAHLAGRWVGNAVMTPSSGPQASFKCIVTYLPRKDAPGMKQSLRCENATNFKLYAATELVVEDGKVVGRWQDKINEIEGTVDGVVTPTGFEVQLNGRFFQAKMAVAGEGCDQSVRVLPNKSEVFRELAATLKKC
jgi:hypothetical protein